MKRYLQIVLISFFLIAAVIFFNLYQREKNEKCISAADLGKSYFLPPLSFNFTQSTPVIYPKLTRPINNIGYLREIISEWKWDKSIENNWEFLLNKRIIILQKLKAEIVGNYDNVAQLIDWYKTNIPEDWEFWKFKEKESWEASLAEYYSVLENEINFINQKVNDEAEKTKIASEIYGVMLTHKNDLGWVFRNLPLEEKERIYLKRIVEDVFKSLFGKVRDIVLVDDYDGFYYSIFPITSTKDFGNYNLWFETEWYGGNQNQTISVELWKTSRPEFKQLTVNDRYGLSLGQININENTKQLAVKINLPKNANNSQPPRILFKKIIDPLRKAEILKIDQKRSNISLLFFRGFILFSVFSSYLTFIFLRKLKFFKQRLSANFLESNKRKYSFIFVTLFAFGVFLGWKNWDFLAIITFFFLTIISFIWNLSSSISFLIAFFLMVSSLIMMILKKENRFEILSIFSFFIVLLGTLQMLFEDFRNKIFKVEKAKVLGDIVNTFFSVIASTSLILVIIGIVYEVLFYRDYYRKKFLSIFISSVTTKMIGLWILGIVLIWLFVAVLKKVKFIKKICLNNNISFKIISLTVLFVAFWRFDPKLFEYLRSSFEHNPHIFDIIPTEGTQGSTIEVQGHNFRDSGTVFLNGVQQKILDWSNKKIIIELTDELSDSGLLKVSNSFEGKSLESNNLIFTFIDTFPPAEIELDL